MSRPPSHGECWPHRYLFIGGPVDGERLDVMSVDQRFYARDLSGKFTSYRSEIFDCIGERTTIFIADDLTVAQAFGRMLDCYSPNAERETAEGLSDFVARDVLDRWKARQDSRRRRDKIRAGVAEIEMTADDTEFAKGFEQAADLVTTFTASKAEYEAATCPDCKGTRRYQPLTGPAEPCRTCCVTS